MLPWQWTNGVLRGSMRALSKDAKLVRSTSLPREIWVLRTVGSKFAEFLFAIPVLAVFAIFTGAQLHWQVVYFPLAAGIQAVLLTGAGLILAPLATLYGDVQRLMRIVLRLLFYFSPILYGINDVATRFDKEVAGRLDRRHLRVRQPVRRDLRPLPHGVLPRPVGGLVGRGVQRRLLRGHARRRRPGLPALRGPRAQGDLSGARHRGRGARHQLPAQPRAATSGCATSLRGRGTEVERKGEFWALRDISFQVGQGEAVGLVGGNGQGKSTLLKLIAGVLLPDEGRLKVRGGVAPLIEVTGGFVGDLTARDNIWLTAGPARPGPAARSPQRFDEIVDFAEVGDFLDTPFRHFSSGMKVRLGFSVVTTLDEPIVLVDEVLAVGDRAFREKCYGRMNDLLSGGRTLFLVSHNEADLRRFCTRGLYLKAGSLVVDGPLEDALTTYRATSAGAAERKAAAAQDPDTGEQRPSSSSGTGGAGPATRSSSGPASSGPASRPGDRPGPPRPRPASRRSPTAWPRLRAAGAGRRATCSVHPAALDELTEDPRPTTAALVGAQPASGTSGRPDRPGCAAAAGGSSRWARPTTR